MESHELAVKLQAENIDLQAEVKRLRDHEKWLKLGHETADGFLDIPSQSHIVDKVCIIGHERDDLRLRNNNQAVTLRTFERTMAFQRAELLKSEKQIDELRAAVAELPKCWQLKGEGDERKLVQDCPVVPEMEVWVLHFDISIPLVKVSAIYDDGVEVACEYKGKPAPMGAYFPADCYNSLEAAEFAKEKGAKHD